MAKRILLVEDDLDIQRIYAEKLTNSDYEVILCSDSSKGYTLAKTQKFDLILLDIMLPGKMNGFELLDKLKADSEMKDIPVIILTNLDSEKEHSKTIGAADYLIKANTSLSELVEKVKSFT